jgi:WD40 repeat protein
MLDGSGPASRIVARGWTLVDGYSVDGSQIVVGRRPDGAASGSAPSEIAVLDTASGQIRTRLPIPSRAVEWVGDDILFGQIGVPQRSFLDLGTGTSRSGETMPGGLASTYLDSSGTWLFAVRSNGEIWSMDPTTGRRIEPTIHTDGPVWSVSWSMDHSEIFVTAFRQTKGNTYWTSVYDGRTGEELRTGLEDVPWTALSAQGEIISTRENRIMRHSGSSFSLLGTLPAVPGELDSVKVSADGRTLIAFSPEHTIAIYDLTAGIPIGTPLRVESDLGELRADGAELAVDARGGVAVWDLRPDAHRAAACRIAGRDLTREEWAAHLGGVGKYRSTCGFGEE